MATVMIRILQGSAVTQTIRWADYKPSS